MHTVEQLKKQYREMTDKELVEELQWRTSSAWTSRMLGAEGVEILTNIRTALSELIKERGLA